MDEAINICPVCGARMRQERKRCLRCGADLPVRKADASSADETPSWLATHKVWVAAATALVVLLAAGAVIVGNRRPARATGGPTAGAGNAQAIAKPATAGTGTTAQGKQAGRPAWAPAADPHVTARVAYENGDYQAAFDGYKKAVDRNPDDADSQSNCGQALVRLGRVAEAIPYLERAIRLNDRIWAFHFNLAHASGLLNQWDRAVDEYGAAQKLFPDDYVTEYNLANALHKRGDEAAAVEHFRRAVELRPSEADFHLSLAMATERLGGQSAEAAAEYRRYLELAPGSAEAGKVRARLAALEGAGAAK